MKVRGELGGGVLLGPGFLLTAMGLATVAGFLFTAMGDAAPPGVLTVFLRGAETGEPIPVESKCLEVTVGTSPSH